MANVYNKPIIISGGGSDEIPVDNGPIYEGKYRVRYFDLDGTILKIEYVANGGRTTPPQAPVYDPDYLIFDEWNYDIANYIVEQPTDIGAIYKTVDDITYLFIRLTENIGLTIPTLQIANATSIDWGDGTIDTNLTHTYTKYGEYIIKISGMTSITTYLFGSGTTVYNTCLKKCYLRDGVISLGQYAFNGCETLINVSIPKTVTSISGYSLSGCYSIKHITIPKGITTIPTYMFNYCYSLTSVSIPETVTSVGTNAFTRCYPMKSLIIPKNVTSIGANAFASCSCVTNYIFNCSSVPTLSNTNAFNQILESAIMWVNDSIAADLRIATNWSTYVNRIKDLSSYPNFTDPNPPTGIH